MIYEHHRNQLTSDGKNVYNNMLNGFAMRKQNIEINNFLGQNEITTAFLAISLDHPEFFWMPHGLSILVSQGFLGSKITLKAPNIYSEEEIRKSQQIIDGLKQALMPLLKGKTDDEKEKIICDYHLRTVTYEIDNTYNQNAAAVFVKCKAQCSGIAKAVKLLFDWIGIRCLIVNGELRNPSTGRIEPHAWNMIYLNGNWYHLDVTSMLGANMGAKEPFYYLYFNKTDREIQNTHIWNRKDYPQCSIPYSGNPLSMPLTPQIQLPFASKAHAAQGQGTQAKQSLPVTTYQENRTQSNVFPASTYTRNSSTERMPSQSVYPQTQQQERIIYTVTELQKEMVKIYTSREVSFPFRCKIPSNDRQGMLASILQTAKNVAMAHHIHVNLNATLCGMEDVVLNIEYLSSTSKPCASTSQEQPVARKCLPTIGIVVDYRQKLAELISSKQTTLEFYLISPLKDVARVDNILLQNAKKEVEQRGQSATISIERMGDQVTVKFEWQ